MYAIDIFCAATRTAASAQGQPAGLQFLASSGGSPRSDPGDRPPPLRTGFVAAALLGGPYPIAAG